MDSNQILQNYKIHKVLFVGGFNVHQINSKWQMAPILQKKIDKSLSQQQLDWSSQNLARWRRIALLPYQP